MDQFLKGPLNTALTIVLTLAGLGAAYSVYKILTRKEEKPPNPSSLARNPISTIASFATGGLYVPPNLSGGPPIELRGRILLNPGGKTILTSDIVAEGGVISSRPDGTYDFRYRNATYTLEADALRPDGLRIATQRSAGVAR